MNELTQWLNALDLQASLEGWFNTHVLVLDNVIQVGLIVLALLLGRLLGPRLRRTIATLSESRHWRADVRAFVARLVAHSNLITTLIFLWTAAEVGTQTDLFGNHLTRTVASLVNAWVVIRLISGVIKNEALARFIAWTAWILAALTTLGLFDATVALLDGMAMTFGAVRVSVLTVVKGVMALGILLWVTILFIPSFYYQMTPKIPLNTRCSISISKNLSINGRTRSSDQLGIWSYNINPDETTNAYDISPCSPLTTGRSPSSPPPLPTTTTMQSPTH